MGNLVTNIYRPPIRDKNPSDIYYVMHIRFIFFLILLSFWFLKHISNYRWRGYMVFRKYCVSFREFSVIGHLSLASTVLGCYWSNKKSPANKIDCTLVLLWEFWISLAAICSQGMGCRGLKKITVFLNLPPPVCPYVFFYFISCDVKIQEENSAVSAYSLAVFSSVISGFNYYYCWEIDKLKIFYQLVVDFTGFASL